MNLSSSGLPKRVPRRFPVGATYVVEGFGGEQGHLRVISRYVVLPGSPAHQRFRIASCRWFRRGP